MSSVLKRFGRVLNRLNCCKNPPEDVTMIADEDLVDIFFWEDLVNRPKFKFKLSTPTPIENNNNDGLQPQSGEPQLDISIPVPNDKSKDIDQKLVIAEPAVQYDTESLVPQIQVQDPEEMSEINLQETVEMATTIEPEARSEEGFHAMDIWLVEEKDETLTAPLDLVKTVEGIDDLLVVNPDILIVVKGQQFNVHQEVLRAHSLYFEQRLAGKGKTQCVFQIDCEYVDTEAFEIVLHSLYDNKPSVSCKAIPQILRTATYLGIEATVNKCRKALDVSNRNLNSALNLYTTAWELSTQLEKVQFSEDIGTQFEQVVIKNDSLDLSPTQLQKLCGRDFIQRNRFACRSIDQNTFLDDVALKPKVVLLNNEPLTLWNVDVCSTNFADAIVLDASTFQMNLDLQIANSLEILTLNFESVVLKNDYIFLNKDQVQLFFSADVIQARSEIIVYLAALKWLEHDFSHRKEFAVEVLKCVRFSQMTPEEIIACYNPPVLVDLVQMPEVQDLLNKSLQYMTAKAINQDRFFQNPSPIERTLLLKGKPLAFWDLSVLHLSLNPEYSSDEQSDFSTDSSDSGNRVVTGYASLRTQQPNMHSIFRRTKKTHITRFMDEFED